MKVIEAMKQIKSNKEKIAELAQRINRNAAHLSIEAPLYGDAQGIKLVEWTQTCIDISRDNVKLLVRIAKTNLATSVTITIGDNTVTKSISEWVWRRREYAALDLNIWTSQNDRNLREGQVQTSPGVMSDVKLIRYYDPSLRDKHLDALRSEPHLIDSALEVVNAVTDLLD